MRPEELDITTMKKRVFHQIAYLHSPATWASSLATHIRQVHPDPYSEAAPILVSLQPPLLLQWPLTYETPSFTENFGLLLKFKPEIRHVAASIIFALDRAHQLHYNPLTDPTTVQPRLFYGAHLRTGPDAISAGWTPYRVQSQNYLWDAIKAKSSLIYVASDDKEDTWLFAREAKEKGIEVTNALQALSAPILKGELTAEHDLFEVWDSSFKSCVDWIVLSRASIMGGTWESSFSWGIAMARHKGLANPRWGLRPGITPPKTDSLAIAPRTAALERRAEEKQADEQEEERENVTDDTHPVDKLESQTKAQDEHIAKTDGEESAVKDHETAPNIDVKSASGEEAANDEEDLEVNIGNSDTKPLDEGEAKTREDEAASAEAGTISSIVKDGETNRESLEEASDYKAPIEKPLIAQEANAEAPLVAKEKEAVISPLAASTTSANVEPPAPKWVKQAFGDGLTTIFGPEDEGEMFWGAMWP